jgi:hypothetical protein
LLRAAWKCPCVRVQADGVKFAWTDHRRAQGDPSSPRSDELTGSRPQVATPSSFTVSRPATARITKTV